MKRILLLTALAAILTIGTNYSMMKKSARGLSCQKCEKTAATEDEQLEKVINLPCCMTRVCARCVGEIGIKNFTCPKKCGNELDKKRLLHMLLMKKRYSFHWK